MKVTGYSRQQLTRLIRQYKNQGKLSIGIRTQHSFPRHYSKEDILLLAYMDNLHEHPCGAVVKKLCERAATKDSRYERLAKISVSHLYNLRRSNVYQQQRRHFTKTQSKASSIGERRKPCPEGKPGYLRVDTVHQGDQDGQKGVYHINLVDEVTQFEISFSVEKISEHYLKPSVSKAMESLPFKIRGFHTDNGSEYVNKTIAKLLNKLNVEFTKSRARKSNDNALAESKNGSVIRKHFGYTHIPQHWASELNAHIHTALYRYQNFHRPCFFPLTVVDAKGKQRRQYPYTHLMTPFEKLVSLSKVTDHLRPGVTLESLTAFANEMTDEQAAAALQSAKQELFSRIIKTGS